MAVLIPSNDEQQEMAKQVEAIAEAAAQRDSQIAQMLNLVPKAAALSTAASRAISFTKKTWVDDPTSGTPITAADMNRLEQAIVDLNTSLASLQDSVSHRFEADTVTANTIGASAVFKTFITFDAPFAQAPTVVASISSGSGTADAAARFDCQAYSVDATGFMMAIYNNSAAAASNIKASWLAVL